MCLMISKQSLYTSTNCLAKKSQNLQEGKWITGLFPLLLLKLQLQIWC